MELQRTTKCSDRGFTLVELMITVAIVGILAAVAYPSYVESVRKARREDAMAALLDIQMQQEKFRANNPRYTTNLADVGFSSGVSRDGYYTLAIRAADATRFTATATPASGPQADDSCNFSITQNGPVASTDADKRCWSK